MTAQGSLDLNFKIAVDKAGQSEATSATLTAVAALISTGVKGGSASLNADTETTITFASAFSSTSYSLVWSAYDATGNPVAVKITTRSTGNFKATAAAVCTFNYLAVAI